MSHPLRSQRVVRQFKQARTESDTAFCDVCRWAPPTCLVNLYGRAAVEFLHAHHVVPLACGGHDIRENLALLCPNHHALAHALAAIGRGQSKQWLGPVTPELLVAELRVLERKPALWTLRAQRAMRVVPGVGI